MLHDHVDMVFSLKSLEEFHNVDMVHLFQQLYLSPYAPLPVAVSQLRLIIDLDGDCLQCGFALSDPNHSIGSLSNLFSHSVVFKSGLALVFFITVDLLVKDHRLLLQVRINLIILYFVFFWKQLGPSEVAVSIYLDVSLPADFWLDFLRFCPLPLRFLPVLLYLVFRVPLALPFLVSTQLTALPTPL